MRWRRFGSVRARTSLAATAVVAVALVAAGLAVLLSLRSDLTDQAQREADDVARKAALTIASRIPDAALYPGLPLPDDEDHPVQVATEDGELLAVTKNLVRITGTGVSAVRVAPAAPPPAAAVPRPAGTARADRAARARAGDDNGGSGRGRGRGGGDDGGSGSGSGGDDGGGSGGDDDGGSGGGDGGDDHGGADDDDPVVGHIGDSVAHGSGRATVGGSTADYRFGTIEVTDLAGRTVLVHAGASLAARESAVSTAAVTMLVGLPLLLLVVGGVTWLVTRRALTPVEGIRREMAAITASEDLSKRVPEPATHDEVARLARTTNETLTALEASVERQRRFVADASHELRSPIASLRTQLEVGSAHPHLLDVPGAVADTVRLQQLAADLLLLARLDAGEQPGRKRFRLGGLVRESVAQRTADRVPVLTDVRGESEVTGSRGQLGRVLGNLLDNAQRHALHQVGAAVYQQDGQVVLTVSDDGAGVPEAERERIFGRFVRLDDARGRDDGGAGLGLAIARDVARRHGGTLTVREGPGGGALFELRLPRAPDSAA